MVRQVMPGMCAPAGNKIEAMGRRRRFGHGPSGSRLSDRRKHGRRQAWPKGL